MNDICPNKTLTLIFVTLLFVSCSPSEEDRIEKVVDELVAALNGHSLPDASKLYTGNTIPAVNDNGDSNTVFRLLSLDGARDFAVRDVKSVILEDRAQTSFVLTGTMTRGDTTVGEMGMLLRMELEKVKDGWRFIPGQEKKETAM
jgi:hypothetical protein